MAFIGVITSTLESLIQINHVVKILSNVQTGNNFNMRHKSKHKEKQ